MSVTTVLLAVLLYCGNFKRQVYVIRFYKNKERDPIIGCQLETTSKAVSQKICKSNNFSNCFCSIMPLILTTNAMNEGNTSTGRPCCFHNPFISSTGIPVDWAILHIGSYCHFNMQGTVMRHMKYLLFHFVASLL